MVVESFDSYIRHRSWDIPTFEIFASQQHAYAPLLAACDSCERGVRSPKGAKPPAYIFDHFLETRIKQAAFDDPEIARLYDLFGGARMEFFPAYDATATNTSKTSGGNA